MSRSKRFINPDELLSQIVQSDFDLTRFDAIDQSDFKSPSNFYEWITGRDFCNATLLPWQVEAGMQLFSDYCPECSNPDYLGELFDESMGEIQDNIQFLNQGGCPKCKKNRLELFSIGDISSRKPSIKNELIACLRQRSGKSKFVVSAATYQLVKWLLLPDPTGFFNLPKMEVVLGTFSALSAEQAEENLWMPFKGLYDNAPWFKKYNEFLKTEEKRLSLPLVENKDTYIFYPHKRFMCSYTGSDDRKKRGRTRLWGAIDEIAFLNSEQGTSKKKVMDADKNYSALNNSLSTIRQKAMAKLLSGHYDTQMAVMYNASSPYNVQDKIMRLVKSPGIFSVAIQRSTWESNPDYTEQTCRAMNPNLSQVEFDRDFGAIPPFSDSPFIGEGRIMEKLCLPPEGYQPIVDFSREIHVDAMGDRYLYLKAKVHRIDKITPRLLSLDNGYTQNAFAAALFSFNFEKKSPYLNQMFSLYPDPQSGLNIHFPMMFEHFILPLIQGLNIKFVFYDRWQSLDQIQRLRDMKIQAQAHSVSLEKDLLPFKQMLLSGGMILPPCEIPIQGVKDSSNPLHQVRDKPVANLIWQTLTVRQVGKKLLKPLEGDDDLFRAFALGGSRFLFEDIQKHYQAFGGVRQAMPQGGGFVASFHSFKGGGGGSSSGGGGSAFARVRTRSGR